MIHGLSNSFLYTAKHIVTHWSFSDKIITWSGTGFFISKDDDIYLITNRHVVELTYSHPEYAGATLIDFKCEGFEYAENGQIPTQYGSVLIANVDNFIFHANKHNDIACLKNPICDISKGNSGSISLPISYRMLATKEKLDSKLTVCDTIAYPGFPIWYDKKNSTPIFRMGTVASDPRLNYSCNITDPDADRIAYEGFSSSGASGSPVFAIQKGFQTGPTISTPDDFYREVMLVGINAGHYPSDEGHSGISYFYKSSAIIETIDTCK